MTRIPQFRQPSHCGAHSLSFLGSHAQSFLFHLFPTNIHQVCKCVFKTSYLLFSHSVMSDSAAPWTATCQASLSSTISQSLLKLCPLSLWCHPTISSSVTPLSSCPQSFPASGSFPISQLFASGGQSIGASASASVLPVNIQGLFPLRLTYLIFLRPAAQALLQLWVLLVELGPGWWFSWR